MNVKTKTLKVDTVGLTCPHPVLKLAMVAMKERAGTMVEMSGDCPTIEEDVRKWCERGKRTLLSVQSQGNNLLKVFTIML